MATFFHGGASEIQPDGLQTLYLMNPGYVGYPSESQSGTNMLLLNQQSAHQQQLLGIPLQQQQHQVSAASSSVDHTRFHGSLRGGNYSMWTPATANSGVEAAAQELRRASMAPLAQQGGLSLSLSPQQPSYASYRQDREEPSTGMLIGSKYLSAAQQLLDEVVNVRKAVKDDSLKAIKNQMKANKQHDEEAGEGGCAKPASELTAVERQELQMKKAKLASMLDEVDQTYRRYHQQMQIVVSSFEAIAGFGSARAYTSLALQTISKQFRCLKDAIAGQIRATSKSLGEEEGQTAGGKSEGSSRLRFVDHHLRQQRALQQLGMMQHNAWRPQRGLPERAVSVLRAWLFEHFLHPYPKDTDKLMLAKQTGLTRSQVSNWFINARVRLWKPMVEEMYMEETKDHEQQETNGDDALSNRELNEESGAQNQVEESSGEPKLQSAMIPTSDLAGIIRMKEASAYGEDGGYTQDKYKKARADEASLPMNGLPHAMHVSMDFKPMPTNRDFFTMNRRGVEDGGYSFGAFPMGDLGRFDPEQFAPRFSGNGVSLTLGLPHCESLPLSATQPSFLSAETIPLRRRLEMGGADQEVSRFASAPPPNAYENINMQGRKGFAAPLLPDFVA